MLPRVPTQHTMDPWTIRSPESMVAAASRAAAASAAEKAPVPAPPPPLPPLRAPAKPPAEHKAPHTPYSLHPCPHCFPPSQRTPMTRIKPCTRGHARGHNISPQKIHETLRVQTPNWPGDPFRRSPLPAGAPCAASASERLLRPRAKLGHTTNTPQCAPATPGDPTRATFCICSNSLHMRTPTDTCM